MITNAMVTSNPRAFGSFPSGVLAVVPSIVVPRQPITSDIEVFPKGTLPGLNDKVLTTPGNEIPYQWCRIDPKKLLSRSKNDAFRIGFMNPMPCARASLLQSFGLRPYLENPFVVDTRFSHPPFPLALFGVYVAHHLKTHYIDNIFPNSSRE